MLTGVSQLVLESAGLVGADQVASPLQPGWFVLLFLAAMLAGVINTIVGSGTMLTFPLLMAAGLSPVSANMTNSMGLCVGSFAGAFGYRREVKAAWPVVRWTLLATGVGAVVGASILLLADDSVFELVVAWLVLLAVGLIIAGPPIKRAAERRRVARGEAGGPPRGVVWLVVGTFFTGVYGGYFGAAQGVMLLALLGLLTSLGMQEVNGVKNVLSGIANFVSSVVFVIWGGAQWHVGWAVVLALGAGCGGLLGAKVGRKFSPQVLRGVIVVIGLATFIALMWP